MYENVHLKTYFNAVLPWVKMMFWDLLETDMPFKIHNWSGF